MKIKTPIITPEIYLKNNNIKDIKFNRLCHVFFNDIYLRYFHDYNLEQIIEINTFKIYFFSIK
jgi:hypothetical protein